MSCSEVEITFLCLLFGVIVTHVPGVSPGRGLLIVPKRSSKSLFMGDGDEIFLVGHEVMLTLILTIWRTIMNG